MIREYNTKELEKLEKINFEGIENAYGATVRVDNPALCNYYSNITSVKKYVGNFTFDQELSYWDYEFVNNLVLAKIVDTLEKAVYNSDKVLYCKAISMIEKESNRLYELLNQMAVAKTTKERLPKLSARAVFSILTDYYNLDELQGLNSSKWVPIAGLKEIISESVQIDSNDNHGRTRK